MNFVYKGFFTNINSTTDFCTLCRKISRFSVENLLFHSTEKIRRGTLLCFRKFLEWKKVTIRERERERERERASERERGASRLSSKISCLTVPNYFVEETFCVSEKFWYRKILWIRGGGGGREYHDFPSKLFCPTVPKNFVGEPVVVSENSDIETYHA